MRALLKGAFLHDVGKLGIRDAILLKPGKLDAAEFGEMKRHVAHGLDIIERSSWLRDATAVVGHHHEKWDGSGYGTGSAARQIPLPARIFAVADVFDALTSRRPYKEPLSVRGGDGHPGAGARQPLRPGACSTSSRGWPGSCTGAWPARRGRRRAPRWPRSWIAGSDPTWGRCCSYRISATMTGPQAVSRMFPTA